ncbi:MAG: tetratricopeptide repeat protein [Bacteroidales bacterium]|nr:tetratricopeptide repeat protein [Bacteroidales bacterium]
MRKIEFFFVMLLTWVGTTAQVPADSLPNMFQRWDTRIGELNYEDPEIVSLHYLFLRDILKEMDKIGQQLNTTLARNPHLDFYATKQAYVHVRSKAEQMNEIFSIRKSMVDHVFYLSAVEEMAYLDTASAMYHLERSLQYNPHNPDAMLLKCKILLAQHQYQHCVDLIHKVYTQTTLTEEQEKAVSDFTLTLYDRLYTHGSELVKIGRAAEALEVFLALEHFCNNMPSGYCNDDYYQGILRSREGVYESYITIAKEAEKRGNREMAKKFYQYAEEYLRRNDEN